MVGGVLLCLSGSVDHHYSLRNRTASSSSMVHVRILLQNVRIFLVNLYRIASTFHTQQHT